MIVLESDPVILIGGGDAPESDMRAALVHGRCVVAVDSGADRALAAGIMPDAVIGDFDSISPASLRDIPQERQFRITEQDSTDFDKALRNIEAPVLIGVGFMGARLDHQLAACNTLVRFPGQRVILTGSDSLVFLAPPALRLDLGAGCPVSLFPMGAVEGVSDGLQWPIKGLNFAPDRKVGTSNRALGAVEMSMTSAKMLVILPVSCLSLVVSALTTAPSRW